MAGVLPRALVFVALLVSLFVLSMCGKLTWAGRKRAGTLAANL
jgi:hypothetical protein